MTAKRTTQKTGAAKKKAVTTKRATKKKTEENETSELVTKERKLTPKEKLFVQEYLIDLNATQAAKRAGYSEKSAYAIGAENLKKPKIATAIAEEIEKGSLATRTRLVDELAKIALANPTDFFSWGPDGVVIQDSSGLTPEQAACISEVSETKTKDGGTIRIKLSDKQAAIEKLGKALGMFTDKRTVDLNVNPHENWLSLLDDTE